MEQHAEPAIRDGSDAPLAPDVGLFVIWDKARDHQDAILDIIRQRFDVRALYEVHWSPERVSENFSRFYRGRLSPPFRTAPEHQKGRGPFVAIVVADHDPSYGERDTPAGPRVVNIAIHDTKAEVRSWIEEPYSFHSSDNRHTAARELILLFGRKPEEWLEDNPSVPEAPEAWNHDLIATAGWQSLPEMYDALGAATVYVDLDGGHRSISEVTTDSPIRLLTDEPKEVLSVLAARPRSRYTKQGSGAYTVRIEGRPVPVDVRTIDDGFIDPTWATHIIESRTRSSAGVFSPDPQTIFEVTLYRTVVHHRRPPQDCVEVLQAAKRSPLEIDQNDVRTPSAREHLLRDILRQHGRVVTHPDDPEISFNPAFSHKPLPRLQTGLSAAAWQLEKAVGTGIVEPFRVTVLSIRERLVVRYPKVREFESKLRP